METKNESKENITAKPDRNEVEGADTGCCATFKNQVRYRDHRGGLVESLNTTIPVSCKQDIIDHLNEYYHQFEGYNVEEIKLEYIGYDERCDWDTYYVLMRLSGQTEFSCTGMTDGNLDF